MLLKKKGIESKARVVLLGILSIIILLISIDWSISISDKVSILCSCYREKGLRRAFPRRWKRAKRGYSRLG